MLILLKGKWFCPASDCGCALLYVLLSCSQWSWYWGGLPFHWLLSDDTQTGYLAIAWSETSLLFPIHWVHYLFLTLLKDLVEDLAWHWQKHNFLVLQFLRSSFFGSIMRMLSLECFLPHRWGCANLLTDVSVSALMASAVFSPNPAVFPFLSVVIAPLILVLDGLLPSIGRFVLAACMLGGVSGVSLFNSMCSTHLSFFWFCERIPILVLHWLFCLL